MTTTMATTEVNAHTTLDNATDNHFLWEYCSRLELFDHPVRRQLIMYAAQYQDNDAIHYELCSPNHQYNTLHRRDAQ